MDACTVSVLVAGGWSEENKPEKAPLGGRLFDLPPSPASQTDAEQKGCQKNKKGVRNEWRCPRRFCVISPDFFATGAALSGAIHHASKIASLSPRCFSIFQRWMIQSDELPLREILDSPLLADVFEEDKVDFGIADEDVFTPAITLWAMISQCLFTKAGRSCKAAAGRVVSLLAVTGNRVVAQNAGNYCRAKAKIPISTVRKIALRIASEAEIRSLEFDDPDLPLDGDIAEERLSPQVIAAIRAVSFTGRIIMVDGVTIDAPDTHKNQAKYPQNPAQAVGLGFPILRCACLVSMLTGMLIDLGYAKYCGKGTGETAILRQLRSSLKKGDILVADSYYCNYWLIAMCLSIGVHVVMKNHHLRDDDPVGAKRSSKTERTVKWVRPRAPELDVEEGVPQGPRAD